jgi:hypothetical protein
LIFNKTLSLFCVLHRRERYGQLISVEQQKQKDLKEQHDSLSLTLAEEQQGAEQTALALADLSSSIQRLRGESRGLQERIAAARSFNAQVQQLRDAYLSSASSADSDSTGSLDNGGGGGGGGLSRESVRGQESAAAAVLRSHARSAEAAAADATAEDEADHLALIRAAMDRLSDHRGVGYSSVTSDDASSLSLLHDGADAAELLMKGTRSIIDVGYVCFVVCFLYFCVAQSYYMACFFVLTVCTINKLDTDERLLLMQDVEALYRSAVSAQEAGARKRSHLAAQRDAALTACSSRREQLAELDARAASLGEQRREVQAAVGACQASLQQAHDDIADQVQFTRQIRIDNSAHSLVFVMLLFLFVWVLYYSIFPILIFFAAL